MIATAFSLLVCGGEVLIFLMSVFSWKDDLSFEKTLKYLTDLEVQLVCFFPFIYLSISTFVAWFNLKVSSLYGLYPNKHTDSVSLVFFGV